MDPINIVGTMISDDSEMNSVKMTMINSRIEDDQAGNQIGNPLCSSPARLPQIYCQPFLEKKQNNSFP